MLAAVCFVEVRMLYGGWERYEYALRARGHGSCGGMRAAGGFRVPTLPYSVVYEG